MLGTRNVTHACTRPSWLAGWPSLARTRTHASTLSVHGKRVSRAATGRKLGKRVRDGDGTHVENSGFADDEKNISNGILTVFPFRASVGERGAREKSFVEWKKKKWTACGRRRRRVRVLCVVAARLLTDSAAVHEEIRGGERNDDYDVAGRSERTAGGERATGIVGKMEGEREMSN